MSAVIAEAFDDYMGARYEAAFVDHLRRIATDVAPDVVAVGEWWRDQAAATADPCQLDAVVLAGRRATPVAVGEAKWARKVNGSSVLGGMRRKLHESGLAHPDDVAFYVCARDQVTRSDGVNVVTAADIFG